MCLLKLFRPHCLTLLFSVIAISKPSIRIHALTMANADYSENEAPIDAGQGRSLMLRSGTPRGRECCGSAVFRLNKRGRLAARGGCPADFREFHGNPLKAPRPLSRSLHVPFVEGDFQAGLMRRWTAFGNYKTSSAAWANASWKDRISIQW